MSQPLKTASKAARRIANDARPVPVFTGRPVVRSIKLTYRPAGPSRLATILLLCVMGGMTGLAGWCASKALALFVAAQALTAEALPRGIYLPVPRAWPVEPPVQAAALPPAVVQVAQAVQPAAPEIIVPAPVAETPDGISDIALPAEEVTPPQTSDPALNAVAEKLATTPALGGAPEPVVSTPQTPPEQDRLLDHARALMENGDDAEALAAYKHILAADPVNHAALAGSAFILARDGDYANAIAAEHRLLKRYPEDTAARLGLIQMLAEDPSPAAPTELKRMAAINPDSAPVHAALARQYERQGDRAQAIRQLDRAARAAPYDLSYRLDLAVLYDRGNHPREALILYQQVLRSAADGNAVPPLLSSVQQRADYLAAQMGAAGKN
jgi:tetratricopeptide (TPR) repeat protein